MRSLVINQRFTAKDIDSFNKYLKEISLIELLTPEQEKELTIKAFNGDEKAAEELVLKNLRFVVSVAKQYGKSLIEICDLVNEGNIGLIVASKKFDPSMGARFLSYAVWRIRKSILDYLNNNGRLVRIPANKINSIKKFENKIKEMEQKLGRKIEYGDITPEEYDDYLIAPMMGNNVDSFDREIFNDGESGVTLGDLLADDTIPATDSNLTHTERVYEVRKLLSVLKPREREIIIKHYGLDGNYPRSFTDLSVEYNITKEMIRQIKNKAIIKLQRTTKNFVNLEY
jgi:RNA polymerase primary sigma factor